MELGCKSSESYKSFETALNKVVVFTDHTDKIYSDYGDKKEFELKRSCGLTCYIDQSSRPLTNDAYRKTAWATYIWGK